MEQSLMGVNFAKSKTVHKFDDLKIDSACALINDIVAIYHYYCKGKIVLNLEDGNNELHSVDVAGTERLQLPTIPNTVLKNIDKSKEYILKFVLGNSYVRFPDETYKTSEIDEWGIQFLPILFEGKSIMQFNTGLFVETLKMQQSEEYHQIVQIRWKAIQAYFEGNIAKCIEQLECALKLAKEEKQPTWVIKDILIDLRNQHLTLNTINNCYSNSEAQKELSNSSEEVYYPILDRIHNSLHEKYIEGLYKKKTSSPYSVVIGNNLEQYGDLLASSYIVSLYNGSLTHILLLYEKVKDFLFYLSSKYDDWNFRRDMMKLAIYEGKEKDIKGIQDSYPEVLNNLTARDAEAIMEFCNNHPIKYKRFIGQLLALGTVGYFLTDNTFSKYSTLIVKKIKEWLEEENATVAVGTSIFFCLSGIAYRISQDDLAEICCLFMDKHYRRWYADMFRLIANRANLNKMSDAVKIKLVERIIGVLEDEKDREQVKCSSVFLCVLRNQDRELTKELENKVEEFLPQYYNGDYKLETAGDEERDVLKFLQNYAQCIQDNNDKQGKDGVYYGRARRNIATVRSILVSREIECDNEILDSIISAVIDTLLTSKEDIRTKLDAVSLLVCIVIKYRDAYMRNLDLYKKLVEKKDEIDIDNDFVFSSNIDAISLKICLQFLFTSMGIDTYAEFLVLMPYIQNDIATTISVATMIVEYLEVSEDVAFPKAIESVILQNVLQWLRSEHLDVRWNATRILLMLIRNLENVDIVNRQLISLVDSDCVYIKNLIMRNIYTAKGVSQSTKEYIFSKCENDANFVVRMVCADVKKNITQEIQDD